MAVHRDVPHVTGTHNFQLGVTTDLVYLVTAQLDNVKVAVLVAQERLLAVLDDLIIQAVQLHACCVVVIRVFR
ncbi:hypothetical protein SDC9_149528 [bioreactor metagenome]|uniref:Uncharacterized protein n=1 Tax=bioreactor metagenome TaxID=1076179 RepID=A0A645EM00_9ZZZZ